uniref:Uncharacterized protein n=1 Tax=Neogobius melanostomus TaxID=47308 RepID=A0A8C6SHB2_9GOBI
MSKLSFRALDASKPLPVFRCEDLPICTNMHLSTGRAADAHGESSRV